MKKLFGFDIEDEYFDFLFCEQTKGKEIAVENGKVVARDRVVTQEELNQNKIAELDNWFKTTYRYQCEKYTRLIALSGLIIGISATFSMASSEFLAARSERRDDAFKSCTYTGMAYLITVVLLVLPYLLLGNDMYLVALACMLTIVILIIAGFTYYTSVALDQPFRSRFIEMAGISISVAVLSFGVGILAKRFLGVDI